MNETGLTEEQLAQFHADGFVVLREFIPQDMLAELREGYDAATRGELDVDGWRSRRIGADIAVGVDGDEHRGLGRGVHLFEV